MEKSSTTTAANPSVREIARMAGVSISTVSRALNAGNKGIYVSEKTKAKIDAVCQQLNYSPNIHATRLFAQRSNAIALVVPPWGRMRTGVPDGLADPNLSNTLAGLSKAASENKQELVLLAADEQFIESKKYLSILRSRQVDGVVVWGASPEHHKFVVEIAEERWPIVMANSFAELTGIANVRADNYEGGAAMGRRLVELGHKQICYLAGPSTASAGVYRQRGFEAVCREYEVALQIKKGVFSFECGQQLAHELLTQEAPPTAIAAVSDLVALGVIDTAQKLGLSVPKDLSVTGGDGVFPYYKPKLTTFKAPMEKIGQKAMEILLGQITSSGEEDSSKFHFDDTAIDCVVPIEVIEGKTVGKLRIKNYE